MQVKSSIQQSQRICFRVKKTIHLCHHKNLSLFFKNNSCLWLPCEHIEFQKGDKVSVLRATRGSWKICLHWLSLKHTQTWIQFVCVICCHSKLMWFRTQDWHLSSMRTKHTPTAWIYMFKHTPTPWILQCHRKNLSFFFLSLSLPLSKQSDTVTKLSRALAHGNTWTWSHWQRHEPEWCLSLTATRTLTLDHQAHTVKTCTHGLQYCSITKQISLSFSCLLLPFSLSLSLLDWILQCQGLNITVSREGSCEVCSGCKTRILENMFIVFSEAHKNISWFHTCCSQMFWAVQA